MSSCVSVTSSVPSSLSSSSLPSSSVPPTEDCREGEGERERCASASGFSEKDEANRVESSASSIGLSSPRVASILGENKQESHGQQTPEESPPTEKDRALATAGARAVEELLVACNALLSQWIRHQEREKTGGCACWRDSSRCDGDCESLVKAMNAVFDFWPLTDQAQPASLTDFCGLVSRSQQVCEAKKAFTQSQASPTPDRDDSQQSCASVPPARSLILEPSTDEMEDLFAVLTSPNRSLEKKTSNTARDPETAGQANRPSAREDHGSVILVGENSTVALRNTQPADVSPVSPDPLRPATVSSGDETRGGGPVVEDLDDDLDCSLVLPAESSVWCENLTGPDAGPRFSQEDLPLVCRPLTDANGPSRRSSKPPLHRTVSSAAQGSRLRDDESRTLLSEVEAEENESIASWANARRKRERAASSASPSAAPSRCPEKDGGPGEADPFHGAFQRMQKIFGRGAARERHEGRDFEDRRTTLVCGATAQELVQDLPAHLRRWFARSFPFSERVDRINKELGAINAVMSRRDCFLLMLPAPGLRTGRPHARDFPTPGFDGRSTPIPEEPGGRGGENRRRNLQERRDPLRLPVGRRLPRGLPLSGKAKKNVSRRPASGFDRLRLSRYFRMSINRPNLFLEVREKSRQTIYDIHRLLSSPPLKNEAGIIYCLSIKDCEVVASHLISLEIRAAPCVDGRRHRRDCLHCRFRPRRRSPRRALRLSPLHASVSGTEIGRAGRDGFGSRCILFYSPADVQRVSKLLVRPKRGSGGERGEKGRLSRLEKMVHFCEASVECRRQLLLQAFGENLCESAVAGCGDENARGTAGDRGLSDGGPGEEGADGDLGLQTRAKAENSWMRKGKICARSCDNCWKKTHLTVQVSARKEARDGRKQAAGRVERYHDVTVYAQKLVHLLLAQERTCGTGYGSGLTRKQLCDAARGSVRQQPLQDKLRHNEHLGCMKSIATGDIETLIRHMVKDRWLVETVVSKKGRFASYVILRPGEAAHTPLMGPKPLIVPNFLRPSSSPRPRSPKISSLSVSLDRSSANEESSAQNGEGRESPEEVDSSVPFLYSQLSTASKGRQEAAPSAPPRKKHRFVVVPEVLEDSPTNSGAGLAPCASSAGASNGGDPDLDGDLDGLLGLPLGSNENIPSFPEKKELSSWGEVETARSGSLAAKRSSRPTSLQQLLREERRDHGAKGQEGRGEGQRADEGISMHSPTFSSPYTASPSCRPPSAAAMLWRALSEDTPLETDGFSDRDKAMERERSFSMCNSSLAPCDSLDTDTGKTRTSDWVGPESRPDSLPGPNPSPLSGTGGQNGSAGPQLQQKRRTHQTTLSSFVRPKKSTFGPERETQVEERTRRADGDEARDWTGAGGERRYAFLAEQRNVLTPGDEKGKEPEDSKAEVAEAIRQAQIDAMKRNGVTRKLPASWLRRP
uniref:Uncharacterized protein n=1 Tax=Neospora caninum (strain Liverpool) TaxID=572307 RepID=F0JB90_NEOCL|nr:hypothetical protein NCLIV_070020 [Neospora caninum Liverpool]CEL71357.1 TPA: hypothetical protein BN1204_070020 [Neospora caninum Liverpool]